jgi:hypothetical protein
VKGLVVLAAHEEGALLHRAAPIYRHGSEEGDEVIEQALGQAFKKARDIRHKSHRARHGHGRS